MQNHQSDSLSILACKLSLIPCHSHARPLYLQAPCTCIHNSNKMGLKPEIKLGVMKTYRWGANLLPEDRKFAQKLTGNYNGPAGDQTPVPDFYDMFAVGHQKPMAIAETAAMFNTQADATVDAYHMKVKWMEQVSEPALKACLYDKCCSS